MPILYHKVAPRLAPNKQRKLNTYADNTPKTRITNAKFSRPNIRELPTETQRRKALHTALLNRPYIETELELFDALDKRQHNIQLRGCFKRHIIRALTGELHYVRKALITNPSTGISTPTIYKSEKLVNINDYHIGLLYRKHLIEMERNHQHIQLASQQATQSQALSTSPFAKLKGLFK